MPGITDRYGPASLPKVRSSYLRSTKPTSLKRFLLKAHQRKGYIFIPYLALNDPDWDLSFEIIEALFSLGADSIELGLPFTDPIADGIVLQKSFSRILAKDFHLDDLFLFLGRLNQNFKDKFFLVMGYANLFYQYGYSKLCIRLSKLNVKGLVIPDIPFEEKENNELLKPLNIPLIDFITPSTKDRKLNTICRKANGFLYLVSTKGVTGKSSFDQNVFSLAGKIKKLTDIPVIVGFGIRSRRHIQEVIKHADGFIIGSLIHEIIQENLDHKTTIPKKILKTLKGILP